MGTGFSTDPRDINLGLENCEATVALCGTIWSVTPIEALLPLQAAAAIGGKMPVIRVFNANYELDSAKFPIS